jgi:undecaprenyl-diphosphatase
MAVLSDKYILKGGLLVTMLWWLWFKPDEKQTARREQIISTIFGCMIALLLARVLAHILPFRARPIDDPGMHFVRPYDIPTTFLHKWSSFPSDHAALFFALSIGLYYASKKAGILAIIYTVLFIMFPRVYLGLHYPSDIVGGALLGAFSAWITNSKAFRSRVSAGFVYLEQSRPQFFYSAFFLVTFQIADMFDGIRDVAALIRR